MHEPRAVIPRVATPGRAPSALADPTPDPAPDPAAALFAGDGEVRALARALDWGATPLGPVPGWPAALRGAVRLCLESPFPIALWCGPSRVLVYNDGYRAVLGAKHPAALGRPGAEVWAEIWDELLPLFAGIDAGGPPVYAEDARFAMQRAGDAGVSPASFTFGLSAVRDDDGALVAYFNPATETTARVAAEAALAESRRRLDAALLAGEVGTFQWEIVGDRLWGDPNFGRIFGIALDETGAAPLADYLAAIHPDDRPRVAALIQRTLETGASYETEYRIVAGADEGRAERWVEVRGRVEYEASADGGPRGRPLRFPGVVQDVTRRRDAEAAFRASAARYQALLTSVDAGFMVIEVLFDADGRPRDYRFDPLGRRITEIAPDIEPFWLETYGRVATTGEPARFAHAAAAFARTYEVFAYRVDDPALRRVAVLFTDVTAARAVEAERERLLAEAEAARAAADLERRRLEALLDQLPVGVHLAEAPDGRLVLGNAAVRRIWGGAPPSARIADYSPDYVAYHRSGPRRGQRLASDEWPLARALRTGAVVSDEVVDAERPDGSRRIVSLSAAPVRDAEGQVVGGVVTSTDVTERERLLAESEAARAEAERAWRSAEAERARAVEANQAKAQFLASMSHELRTPLNAIGGYAELLALGLRGPLGEAQREDLARIRRANQHLTGLVTDILNFAKLEAGQVEYQLAPVALAPVVADVEALVAPQLAAKGLAFYHDSCTAGGDDGPGAPPAVRADAEKLRQVLLNLLTNAVKFTDRGGRVALRCEPDAAAGVVRLRVVDTGRGIPADRLEAVFEPFVQVDRHRTPESQQGVGLGLAISRDLARGMGGELTVESAVGEGSTFTLVLPVA